ncbi:MAG: tetratricopeptide repeat protein [Chloroflexi bacterium]|nr:tetratricopeptide repeat protein [Chloroflexota bacterium]
MKSKRKSREPSMPAGSGEYRQGIRQADEVITKNGIEILADNWQQLALDWFAPREPDRSALARYITANRDQIGVAWAREILRLQVFFGVPDYKRIVEHYDRAFRSYPRCALIEMWVAGYITRTSGDFWRARQMYWNAATELPSFAKPHYELGFMNYLLGDFPGAVERFNQAVTLVAANDAELGSRIFYNRGLVRMALEEDKQAAIADVEEALRRKPDYAQAKETLRALKGKHKWVPW